MVKNGNKLSNKTELPTELKLENTVDTSGMWFTAAVLFAVSSIAPPMTEFALRRMILCPRQL
jgi:hypothetical protein